MKMVSRAFLLLLLTAASGLMMTRPARAQGTATQAAVAETRPVRLVLSPAPSSGEAGLALDRLREGIEAELGRPVSVDADAAGADVLSVIYQPELEALTVFYKPRGGRAIVARCARAVGSMTWKRWRCCWPGTSRATRRASCWARRRVGPPQRRRSPRLSIHCRRRPQ